MQKACKFLHSHLVLTKYSTVLSTLTGIINVKLPDYRTFQNWLITELLYDVKEDVPNIDSKYLIHFICNMYSCIPLAVCDEA